MLHFESSMGLRCLETSLNCLSVRGSARTVFRQSAYATMILRLNESAAKKIVLRLLERGILFFMFCDRFMWFKSRLVASNFTFC